MKHYGDITKLSGYTLPPVDCICGGSPCQDLSTAGKRAGLEGQRSGLFMEQIRIIREMREHDRSTGRPDYLARPRYMVWENVEGALTSPGKDRRGEDFRAVLTEVIRIAQPEAPDVPMPKDGKWSKCGCLYDELGRWSVAWTVHNAAEWGVPQRRVRVALVADFGGLSAPEICFERKGLRRDNQTCGEKGQEVAGCVKDSVGWTGVYGIDHAMLSGGTTYRGRGYYEDESGCLKTQPHGVYGEQVRCYGMDNERRRGPDEFIDQAPSLTARAETGGNNVPCVETISFQERAGKPGGGNGSRPSHKGDGYKESETMYTLNATEHHAVVYDAYQHHGWRKNDTVGPLTRDQNTGVRGDTPIVTDIGEFNSMYDASPPLLNRTYKDPHTVYTQTSFGGYEEGCGTLRASGGDYGGGTESIYRDNVGIVRRLTPIECERLQGFPDNWTDIGSWTDTKGKLHKESSDASRYKALGNSIALPYWFYLLRRISAQYERPATMASLFDGIGGFPLCWERCNGKGTAIWASEIEEFPIAVTKRHFPE